MTRLRRSDIYGKGNFCLLLSLDKLMCLSLLYATVRFMRPTTLCAAALVAFLPQSAVAQEWRGLIVAPEERCAPYDPSEYQYPQSVEPRIADSLGGVYSPYTCETFRALNETDIEHIVARSASAILPMTCAI